MVLDCARIAYIGIAGVGVLLTGAKSCMQEGGGLAIAALRPDCRAVMEASGLLSILGCHETVEAALAALAAGGAGRRKPEYGPDMEIGERHEGRAIVLSLNGRLDSGGAAVLMGRISTALERGAVCMVLDCAGMSYVNSTGLRALPIGTRACRQVGG